MSEEITIWESGFVKGFQFVPYNKELSANIMGMNEGQMVERMIRRIKKKPSKELHGYYRGVIIPTALNDEQFRGWSRVDVHNHFKSLFLKDVKEMQMGSATVLVVDIQSTSDISKKRMSQFIEDVRRYLAERGIETPDPHTPEIKE